MICNRCGAKNSDSRTQCFHCGNPLHDQAGTVLVDELPSSERSHSFHDRWDQDKRTVKKAVPLTIDDEEDLLESETEVRPVKEETEEAEVRGDSRRMKGGFQDFYAKAFVPEDEDDVAEAKPQKKKSFRERYDAAFVPDDEEEAPRSARRKRPAIDDSAYDPETNAFVVAPPEQEEDSFDEEPVMPQKETEPEEAPAGPIAYTVPAYEPEEPMAETEPEEDPDSEPEEAPVFEEDEAAEAEEAEDVRKYVPEEVPEETAEEISEEAAVYENYDNADRSFDEQLLEESRRKAAEMLVNADEEISEVALDEDEKELVFQNAQGTRRKRSVGVTIVIWLLVLLFILIGITLGVLYYRLTHPQEQPPIINPNQGAVEKLNLQDPILKKALDPSGKEYIHAVFYGEPGDRIYLSCNNSYHTFTENSLEMNLYLEDLFDSEYEFLENVVNANPNAYHVRDGKKYPYNTPSFSIAVPESQLELLAPTKQSMKVYQDRYAIELWTSTDAKVTLNNNNITSYMDGSGIITYNVDVPEQTSTTYQLEVTQPYHTSRSEVFIISRDTLAVNLTIATSSASIIHEPYIEISGSTEAGAVISSSLPTLDFSRNDVYNTYSMRVNLNGVAYGKVEVVITADAGDGRVSSRSHTFWYWPDEVKTTTSAYKFDSAVATNPSAYRNQNFKLSKARVTKILSANKFETAVTYNNVEYTMIVTNENRLVNGSVSVGSTYNIFAQCTGSREDGVPVFRAWYVYSA